MSNDDFLLDEFKERELEILGLMAEGYSNVAIGEKLFITKETVRWYNKQIYSKLGTSRRTEAIAKAQRLGLIGSTTPVETTTSLAIRKDNLPVISTPFLGRNSEIAAITELLNQPHTPLVTVLGPGGMGKTRLAIELGHRLLDQFEDGVYLFELAALTQVEAIVNTVLHAMKLSDQGKRDSKEVFFEHCREKKLLLIFDNFEHLLDGAILIDELIQAAPELRIVVTSRERLNLYGETVYELSGLQKQADRLFIAIAQTLKPDFRIRENEQGDLDRILHLVGGLPLGIILAASWVDTLTVAEIVAEISQDLDMLTTEMRNVPERQRSMRAVLSASWQKLSRREKMACMKLAIFKGGFGRNAASKVAEASLPVLQKLQHKSFLQRVAERRYDLHPLIRQFALEQLEDSGQLEATHQQHLNYYQKHISELLQALDYGDYIHPLNQVELEHENIRLGLDWGLSRPNVDEAVALVSAMYPYWENRSYAQEGNHYLELALKCTSDETIRAALLIQQSRFLGRLKDLEIAEAKAREALEFAQMVHELDLQLESLWVLTKLMQDQAHYKALVVLAGQYVTLSKSAGRWKHLATALSRLGMAHEGLGNRLLQEDAARQALQLGREQEDDVQVSRFSFNLGLILKDVHHQFSEARLLFEESLILKRLIGDRAGAVSRLAMLSRLATLDGDFHQALSYLAEGRTIVEELDLPQRQMDIMAAYGFFYEVQEMWREANQHYKESLALAEKHNFSYFMIYGHLDVARLYLRMGTANQVAHHLQQCLKVALTVQEKAVYTDLLLIASGYFRLLGDFFRSAEYYLLPVHQDRVKPESADYAEMLRDALTAHFSSDEWAAIQSGVPDGNVEQVLRELLAELEDQHRI